MIKKLNLIHLSLATLLCQPLLNADALSDAFTNAKVEGEVRLGFVSQDNDAGLDNKNAALGGSLGIITKEIYGLSAGAKFYTTNRLLSKNDSGSGTGLFGSDDEGFSILGEAYINGSYGNSKLKIGRQKLNTPYTNDNDIRMIPNLFKAAKFTNTDIPDTSLIAIYVTQSAGVDSSTPEEFSDVVKDADGALIVGATYKGIKDTTLLAWYNDIDALSSITHLEASTKINFSTSTHLNLTAQFANYSEQKNSLADGEMYGASLNLFVNNLDIYLAYNSTTNDTGKSVTNFFGGGAPYVTSMDTLTLSGLNNVLAYKIGAKYNITNNFNISYYYGNFDYAKNDNKEYAEQDLFLRYSMNKNINLLLIATNVTHKTSNATIHTDTYDRIRGVVNFSF